MGNTMIFKVSLFLLRSPWVEEISERIAEEIRRHLLKLSGVREAELNSIAKAEE